MMDPSRLEKVKGLIAGALARPPAEREAFLVSACGGDADLRRDVDSFLRRDDKTEEFLHQAKTVPNVAAFSGPDNSHSTADNVDQREGKQFGKYLIQRRIAEGGMGVVYLALDTQLGRDVALKILPEYFSMDKERVARFHREARATSLLNHPNIVTVFEIGQLESCEYIVTEFVEGRTLREIMLQGDVPFVEMLKIASQIAGALGAAHKAGIIHRDIKPENVMLRPDGYVKVLDFGLAKLTDPTRKTPSGNINLIPSGMDRTVPGMIMGTVSYMSPEQAEGGNIDERTDIWSLGVLLYEMVSGKVPFKGTTSSHTIVAILESDPEPLKHASSEMVRIIITALQKDRRLRFASAQEMLAAIDELKHRLGYVSDKNILERPAPAHIAAVPKQRSSFAKFLSIAAAGAVLLLIGAAGVYVFASWILDRTAEADPKPDVVDLPTATPSPEQREQPNIPVSPTPTKQKEIIYVEPTPEDIPQQEPSPSPLKTTEKREPRRRQKAEKPAPQKKPSGKKAAQRQDPNCVFTNSCT